MTYKDIQNLIKLLSKSGLSEFKLKDGDFELAIRTNSYSKTKVIESVMPSPMVAQQVGQVPNVNIPATTAAPEIIDEAEEESSNLIEIKSPMVGTFYRSSSPENPPFIKVGDNINEGDTICIVEAMKLFNEIEAEVTGKVVKVMAENASPVEYDQVLFLIDPNA